MLPTSAPPCSPPAPGNGTPPPSAAREVNLLQGMTSVYAATVHALSEAGWLAVLRVLVLLLVTLGVQTCIMVLLLRTAISGKTSIAKFPTDEVQQGANISGNASCNGTMWNEPTSALEKLTADRRAAVPVTETVEWLALVMLVLAVVVFYVQREVVDAAQLVYVVAAYSGFLPLLYTQPEHCNAKVLTLLRGSGWGGNVRRSLAYVIPWLQLATAVLASCTAGALLTLPTFHGDKVQLVLNGVAVVFVLELDNKVGETLVLAGGFTRVNVVPSEDLGSREIHSFEGLRAVTWGWAWRVQQLILFLGFTVPLFFQTFYLYILAVAAHQTLALPDVFRYAAKSSIVWIAVIGVPYALLLANHLNIMPVSSTLWRRFMLMLCAVSVQFMGAWVSVSVFGTFPNPKASIAAMCIMSTWTIMALCFLLLVS